jgi:hypothetical protein
MVPPPQIKYSVHRNYGLPILGIILGLANFLLWSSLPAICDFVDQLTGRRLNAHNPRIVIGVQELYVYFDPWLAYGVFPIIYTFGFVAIPFLKKPNEIRTESRHGQLYAVVISFLLVALEMVWLMLVSVEVFLRGPNWNIFWPGEQWDEGKLVPLNNRNLSEYFWYWMGSTAEGMSWPLRELPGLVAIGCYLLGGIALAYGLFRLGLRATPYWRWAVLVLLLQIASLVPFKVVCRWLFNIKYLIFVPEHFWNV